MDDLAGVGYRLAPDLCRRILELADEGFLNNQLAPDSHRLTQTLTEGL